MFCVWRDGQNVWASPVSNAKEAACVRQRNEEEEVFLCAINCMSLVGLTFWRTCTIGVEAGNELSDTIHTLEFIECFESRFALNALHTDTAYASFACAKDNLSHTCTIRSRRACKDFCSTSAHTWSHVALASPRCVGIYVCMRRQTPFAMARLRRLWRAACVRHLMCAQICKPFRKPLTLWRRVATLPYSEIMSCACLHLSQR